MTNLSDIYWYGGIKKLHTFLGHMVSNEDPEFHPNYDDITIHIKKDSDAAELEQRPFRNYEKHLEVRFKIVKDL
jgi:hypothetical protein